MCDGLYNSQGVMKHTDWQQYIPLVRHEALKLVTRLPTTVELDDLLQVGYIGLLSAIERYDVSQGFAFTTFATQRIKGAMLDELRSRDWLPRHTRQAIKKITQAMYDLEQILGKTPNEIDIANHLNMTLADYRQVLLDSNTAQLFSYDEMHSRLGDSIDTMITQEEDNNPFSQLINDELQRLIAEQIALLPDKEKIVLVLYYQEDLNLKEIGKVLDISESRVSQLHSQAVKRLKSKISLYKKKNN